MMPILGADSAGGLRRSGPSGGGKIRFHLRSFRSFYRKPKVLNLVSFRGDSVCHGYHGSDCPLSREKKPERIGAVIGGSAVVFTIISVILFGVMVSLARPISVLMQAPEEALDLTAAYVRICGSIFFIVAYNLLSAIFRGLGDSQSPRAAFHAGGLYRKYHR